ncbi:MAG: hypothetical protein SF051_06250 [Elusimicrobiota bacterium]|nr:hypothetical protein [Elusimicrobiota bacterium]
MRHMVPFAALSAASLLILSFAPAQYFGRQQDEVLYLVAAEALASGRYCHLTMPGCPPLVSATPGLPLLLAPLAWFADAPGYFQAFAALLAAAAPWAAWLWLRRLLAPTPALLGALLVGTSPLLLSQSGAPMSEAPYLLASLAFLAAVEDGRDGRAGLLWLLATQLRPAGLSLAPALAAWARGRKVRALAWAAGPALVAAALWAAWSRAATGGVQEGAELAAAYGGRPLRLAAVALDNTRELRAALGGSHLPPALAAGPVAVALGALLAAAAAWGARALLKRRDDPGAWALAGAAAMHLAWPWHYERYLIPLLPLLWRTVAEALGKRAVPVLAVLLAAQAAFQVAPRLGRPSPWARPELARTYAWLAAVPGPWLLASAAPLRDGWWTGKPATGLPAGADAAALARALKERRARFILRQEGLDLGLSDAANAPDAAALDAAGRALEDERFFRAVARFPEERSAVYELR